MTRVSTEAFVAKATATLLFFGATAFNTLLAASANVDVYPTDIQVIEDALTVELYVALDGDSGADVTVHYATKDGTAKAGLDYGASSGDITLNGDSSDGSIVIPITEDTLAEGNETFVVTLTSPSGATFGSGESVTVTIMDNEPAPPGSVELFVTDPDNNSLGHFDSNGFLVDGLVSSLRDPRDAAFGSDGSLYMNNGGFGVRKLDSEGHLSVFAAVEATALAVDPEGNLYVSDFNDVRKLSSTGADLGPFNHFDGLLPISLAFDPAGNLYVGNDDGTVRKLSPTGDDLGVLAIVAQPRAIVVDNGFLYVVNGQDNRIEKFDLAATTLPTAAITTFTSAKLGSPANIAVDANHVLYVLSKENSIVEKFSGSGSDLGTFVDTGVDFVPTALAFKGGDLYLISSSPQEIRKYNEAAVATVLFNTNLSGPRGEAFDAGGNLYVAATPNVIEKYDGKLKYLGIFGTTPDYTDGIAFDHSGNLYATSGGQTVEKFTPAGKRSTFATGFNNAVGLAFDRAGTLFVGWQQEDGTGRIDQVNAQGGRSFFARSIAAPGGLAFDASGSLYAAVGGTETTDAAIVKFDHAAKASTFATGNLSSPAGIAFDTTGNLYVVDQDNGVAKFDAAGNRTVVVQDLSGELGWIALRPSGLVVQPSADPLPPRALNISTRGSVGTGGGVMIAGFFVVGDAPKKVIVRAIGPSLNVNGALIEGALQDPILDLYDSTNTLVQRNDDWRTEQQQAITLCTLPPTDYRESAIVALLEPGSYTAVVSGKLGTQGTALVEVYDLAPGNPAELAQISTRGEVQSGDDLLIGGFVVGGEEANSAVLVRAIGPELEAQGVPNPLEDTTLELHDPQGAVLAFNDDWRTDQEQGIIDTTAAPADDRESAVVIDLSAGPYTAIVRGKGGATGVGLVEVYILK